jgi:uncharacterized membrane protein YtjA (UPF0391 family)
MLKLAIIFFIVSLIAGAIGFTNVSRMAKRIAMVLFALFFLIFLALLAFAYLIGDALIRSSLLPVVGALLPA